ncbi:Ankyrin repeat domain-containing protein 26 [Sticta canariensis]|nr:Ankyrin repeat domain-containing protein 26 [Sticta canariensis]
MNYFQTLVDRVSTCASYVKIVLKYFLIALLTYALKNHFQVLRGINRFLWKRGTDAEEKAEQLERLLREQVLREWGQQEVERRKEEGKRYREDEIGQSAEALRRRIRSREVEEENKTRLAKCLAKEQELEEVYQKLAQNKDEEQHLQFQQEKLSRRIARKRQEQEELKHEQRRLSQNIKAMAVFSEQPQSWEEQLKEAVRREETLKHNKEILANERGVALEEQRRTAMKNERKLTRAEEESTKSTETDYTVDRGSSQFELSDTELDLELGLDCATTDPL